LHPRAIRSLRLRVSPKLTPTACAADESSSSIGSCLSCLALNAFSISIRFRTCVAACTSSGSIKLAFTARHELQKATGVGHPFSRSYGVNLPSSLTRDHSSTLAHLCPATCVGLRYGRSRHPARGFSGRQVSIELANLAEHLSHALTRRSTRLDAATPTPRST